MKKMTIGIFAPSSPAHILFESKYKYAKSRLLELGFNVKEGNLIQNKTFQGYRTASGKERANELMNLILDEDIDILMPVIGGINDKYAGNYRDQQVMISGAQHLPPAPFLLKEK